MRHTLRRFVILNSKKTVTFANYQLSRLRILRPSLSLSIFSPCFFFFLGRNSINAFDLYLLILIVSVPPIIINLRNTSNVEAFVCNTHYSDYLQQKKNNNKLLFRNRSLIEFRIIQYLFYYHNAPPHTQNSFNKYMNT